MAIEKWQVGQIEQLGLGLDLDSGRAGEYASEGEGEGRAETGEQTAQRKEAARRGLEMRLADGSLEASWLEDYLMLRNAGWAWEAAIYVAWAASPKTKRWPKTLEELATECLGLTGPRRIFEWRRKNPAIDETVAMLQAAPLLAHRRDIYEALIASASAPDYKGHQDRKLALELLGDYTPRSEGTLRVSGSFADLSELSEDELARLAGVNANSTADANLTADEHRWTQIDPKTEIGEGEDE